MDDFYENELKEITKIKIAKTIYFLIEEKNLQIKLLTKEKAYNIVTEGREIML